MNVASKLPATWKRKNSSEALIWCFLLRRHLEIPFSPAASPPPLSHQMSGFHCEFEFLHIAADAVIFLFVNVRYSEIISLSQSQPATWELDFEYENNTTHLSCLMCASAASGGSVLISVHSWLSFVFKISLHLWYTSITIFFIKIDMHLWPQNMTTFQAKYRKYG